MFVKSIKKRKKYVKQDTRPQYGWGGLIFAHFWDMRGLNQAEMAELLGCKQPFMSKVIAGEQKPSKEMVKCFMSIMLKDLEGMEDEDLRLNVDWQAHQRRKKHERVERRREREAFDERCLGYREEYNQRRSQYLAKEKQEYMSSMAAEDRLLSAFRREAS